MKSRYLSVILIILFTCTSTWPQRKPVGKGIRSAQPKAAPSSKRAPNYQLNLKIVDGPKLLVSIASPESKGDIDPGDLTSLITDLPTGGDKFHTPNNVFPKVLIEPSPNVTMLDLWNPITLFRRDKTELAVSLRLSATADSTVYDINLEVPWKTEEPSLDVKPSPLLLIVTVNEKGILMLNNEPYGTLSDPEPLIKELMKVFKEREANGVFREGLNEIEKSVTIAMPMGPRKIADLMSVARAVWLPGGKPISLVMDDPLEQFVDERKLIIPSRR